MFTSFGEKAEGLDMKFGTNLTLRGFLVRNIPKQIAWTMALFVDTSM